jgi:hypothetical protein
MLDDLKYLDSKYAHLFPEHELLQIEYIALPIAKVEIQVIGQVVTETTPITEFILKFVDLGINQVSTISEALGISEELALDEVAEEIRQGRIDRSMADKLVLTPLGKETLISSTVRLPKKQKIEIIFDKGSWKLMEWDKVTFIPNAEFRDLHENTLKSFENRKSTIQLKDLDVVSLNRMLKNESKVSLKNTVEILNIQKISQRRHGYRLGRLMIYSKSSTENGYVVLIGDERSEEHENLIRLRGGLDALNIKITPPVKTQQKQKPTAMQVMEVSVDTPYEDDGRLVKSFEHRPILLEALENSKDRFMIIAPWITRAVVNDDMISKLEHLMRSKVAVTIAFGFHDASNPHELKRRDDARILNKLLALSRRYSNFEFRWMGLTSDKGINHSKIFVSDSIYIAGSFNWLSFKGAADRTYRKEDSEMRTKKEVVDARYKSHHDEILKISVPMSEEFVPREDRKSTSPDSQNKYRK